MRRPFALGRSSSEPASGLLFPLITFVTVGSSHLIQQRQNVERAMATSVSRHMLHDPDRRHIDVAGAGMLAGAGGGGGGGWLKL